MWHLQKNSAQGFANCRTAKLGILHRYTSPEDKLIISASVHRALQVPLISCKAPFGAAECLPAPDLMSYMMIGVGQLGASQAKWGDLVLIWSMGWRFPTAGIEQDAA